MIAEARPLLRVVLYEGTGSEPFAAGERFAIQQALLEKGFAVSSVRASANGSSKQLTNHGHQHLVVVGNFSGRPPVLESDDTEVHVIDISNVDVESVLNQVSAVSDETGHATADGWKPWFPVIDYDRCTNCMQCLSFCLFGVYGVSESNQIQVQNENKCKTDCPACSRVCPEVAILFPKYKAGPINGDVVNPEDVRREAMKVDISSLLGGDIYSMLRDRSAKAKSRFSRERDDDRALKERQRCLKKLQEQFGDMDIPAEALANLPSADEIATNAARARDAIANAKNGDPSSNGSSSSDNGASGTNGNP